MVQQMGKLVMSSEDNRTSNHVEIPPCTQTLIWIRKLMAQKAGGGGCSVETKPSYLILAAKCKSKIGFSYAYMSACRPMYISKNFLSVPL